MLIRLKTWSTLSFSTFSTILLWDVLFFILLNYKNKIFLSSLLVYLPQLSPKFCRCLQSESIKCKFVRRATSFVCWNKNTTTNNDIPPLIGHSQWLLTNYCDCSLWEQFDNWIRTQQTTLQWYIYSTYTILTYIKPTHIEHTYSRGTYIQQAYTYQSNIHCLYTGYTYIQQTYTYVNLMQMYKQ